MSISNKHQERIDRFYEIKRMRAEGYYYKDIGKKFGITASRARQIAMKESPPEYCFYCGQYLRGEDNDV